MEKVLGLVTPKLVASHDFIASIATPKSSRRPLADHPDAAIINFLLENLRCINLALALALRPTDVLGDFDVLSKR